MPNQPHTLTCPLLFGFYKSTLNSLKKQIFKEMTLRLGSSYINPLQHKTSRMFLKNNAKIDFFRSLS
jgi:hypothetical protein